MEISATNFQSRFGMTEYDVIRIGEDGYAEFHQFRWGSDMTLSNVFVGTILWFQYSGVDDVFLSQDRLVCVWTVKKIKSYEIN
jgi:hypothetical protein